MAESEPEKCMHCFELNFGMKLMGLLIIMNAFTSLLVSAVLISEGWSVGVINLMASTPMFILAYFYIMHFLSDDT